MSRRKRNTTTASSLTAATATGASDGVSSGGFNAIAWIVRASSVTSGGTVKIQGCESDSATDTDWWDLATVTVSANGTQEVVVGSPPEFTRANVTARTDGTYACSYATIEETGK